MYKMLFKVTSLKVGLNKTMERVGKKLYIQRELEKTGLTFIRTKVERWGRVRCETTLPHPCQKSKNPSNESLQWNFRLKESC